FSQITSDPVLRQRLQSLYGSVDDIDAWVGLLAEDHVAGSSLGPTHMAILMDQFTRLRDGDRLYYRNAGFSQSELTTLESTHLSTTLIPPPGVPALQTNVFSAADRGACPVDLDGNGEVQPADVSAFASAWSASVGGAPPAGDFDGNGAVQPAD